MLTYKPKLEKHTIAVGRRLLNPFERKQLLLPIKVRYKAGESVIN